MRKIILYNKRLKDLLLDIFLGIILPLFSVLALYLPLILENGIPFYGDETYYTVGSSSFYSSFQYSLFPIGTIPLTLFSYSIPFQIFAGVLGAELGVKLFILIMNSLPGILTYFAIKILMNEFFKISKKNLVRISAFVGSLFYMLAFSSGITDPGGAFGWPYITFPISFVLLVRFLKTGDLRMLLLFGALSILGNTQPTWFYLILVFSFVYIVIQLSTSAKRFVPMRRLFIVIIAVIVVNAFWIMPLVTGYLLGASGIFQSYTTNKLINFGSLLFLSHWNLLDVIMLGEHSYYFFWSHPQNYGPLNAIIPILAGSSLLAFRKNKLVLFMGITLVIGIFLTKGANEPAGYLYYLIAKSLPYGAGAILRNPTEFVALVNFSYAFLISLAITKLNEKLAYFENHMKFDVAINRNVAKSASKGHLKFLMISKAKKYVITTGLILLVLTPVVYGTLLDLQGYTWPRYKPTYIPEIYNEINSWLSMQPGNFKVMWIPSGGAYIWKPFILTAFPDLYSSKPAVSFTDIYPDPLNSTNYIGMLLKVLGVKYVIYHGDSISYPNEEILQELMKQKDLKIAYQINYTFLPEDNSKSPLPMEQSGFLFSQSPFKLITPQFLPRGNEIDVIIQYTIPQSVVEEGFKGKFWDGFNIMLQGFTAGTVDLDNRVFWATVIKQKMLNDTLGYAMFNVSVPYTYPYTAIDIYANFYDGGFRPLTPLYFIARLLVYPRNITVPFIVFENEEYVGPIYTINPTLIQIGENEEFNNSLRVSNTWSADLLNYTQISPVEWKAVINASSPFILVFTEPYDRLWRAYVNGKEIEPIPLYGLVNGFYVNQTGIVHIKIYYTLQTYFNIGLFISGISFIILIFLFIYQAKRKSYSKDLR